MGKNVPKLRFKGFEGEWEEKKLNTIFDKISKPVDVEKETYYKQIGIRSHGKGIFYKDAVKGEELGNKRVFWVEPNVFIVNIVFAWERAIARTTEYEIGMIASHRFPMYKPKQLLLNLDFITYLFKTERGRMLLELASPGGAGRNKTLGQKEFSNLLVKLPSLQEQEKIANLLSKVDRYIELQEKKVSELEKYKKGMMQKIFSQKIRFRKDDGGEYPEWQEDTVKNIADIFLGLTHTPTYCQKGIPFLSVKDIKKGKIYMNNIKYISEEEYLNITDNAKPKKGDILFGRVGTLGNPILLKEEVNFAIFVSLGFLRIKNRNIQSEFIIQWMKSDEFSSQINSKISGSSQKNLNTGWLKSFKVNIPIIEEQNKIAKFFSKVDLAIEKQNKRLDELKQWKRGLLQQLFI